MPIAMGSHDGIMRLFVIRGAAVWHWLGCSAVAYAEGARPVVCRVLLVTSGRPRCDRYARQQPGCVEVAFSQIELQEF